MTARELHTLAADSVGGPVQAAAVELTDDDRIRVVVTRRLWARARGCDSPELRRLQRRVATEHAAGVPIEVLIR